MSRVLISIGCNSYDYWNNLCGAEIDAQRVYTTLIDENTGNYDKTRSKLLLSPTSEEAEKAINDALFTPGRIDTLTFYFAGHGSYSSASFYLCLKNSQLNKLSATSFPLAALFSQDRRSRTNAYRYCFGRVL